MRRPATSTCCTVARLIECGAGPSENLLDYGRLRVRVVLHVLPLLCTELALRPRVELSVYLVRAQPIAEDEHPPELLAARRKDVQVHRRVVPPEHAMLEPVRF